jgi:tRNA1Val (adenine37-N6)-methyltransferase
MADFAFKDFVVRQDSSPLKVNTDAIILGAAVRKLPHNAKVLEVGTGNGTIALLLAQRFESAKIMGIDPHTGAFQDAQFNFQHAIFFDRLHAVNCSLEQLPIAEKYDAIVSNPPYFIDGLVGQNETHQVAKHITEPEFKQLLDQMLLRLKPEGQLWLILPPVVAQQTITHLAKKSLSCTLQMRFHANPQKLDKRWVVCFERKEQGCMFEQFYIRNLDGSFHEDYRQLAGEYHDRQI